MRLRLTPLLCIAALLAGGCRSTRDSASTAETTAPAGATATAPDATPTPTPRYTVINFNATVEGISANGQLRMAPDSVIWVSVNKLVELGRAMATHDSVWVNAPLFDRRFAGTYADLRKATGHNVTFEKLQAIATSDDAERRIAELAAQLGFGATVSITERRTTESLRFPFKK